MARIPLRAYNREIEDLIEHDQYDQAIAHCKQILMFFPKHIDTYRLLGKAHLESQRYGDAADVFQRVLSSIPEDFVSHLGMSVIREDEGNLDEAIWHMERAFEMQPANATVQGELRRLHGRRDGLEPQKIRLTRGALARMYVKGDLYPQAIAELRAALAEDPQRLDLLALLAQAYYLAGQKAEAAETSSNLLKKLPYCLLANRLLGEILAGSERASEAESFREQVQTLDPYDAFTSAAAPTPEQVPETNVTLERLHWKAGEPAHGTGDQPDWAASLGARSGELSPADSIPDWLSNPLEETGAPEPGTEAIQSFYPSEPSGTAGESPANVPPFENLEPIEEQPQREIPDWMKDAGWTASSGQEEAGGPVTASDGESSEEEITPAEIPDWLRSVAPTTPLEEPPDFPTSRQETPPFADTPPAEPPKDFLPWLSETQPGPTDSIINWLEEKSPPKGTEEGLPAEGGPSEAEIPEWIQGLGEEKSSELDYFTPEEPEQPIDLPEWLTGAEPEDTGAEIPDWLKGVADQPEGAESVDAGLQDQQVQDDERLPAEPEPAGEDSSEWRAEGPVSPEEMEIEAEPQVVDRAAEETPDWLRALDQQVPSQTNLPEEASLEQEPAGAETGEGAFDWLEGLANQQGAGAAIFPAAEEPHEPGPDWSVEETKPEGEPASPAQALPFEESELPEWMQEFSPALGEPNPSQGQVGVFPVDLSDESVPSADPGDIPDWLREMAPNEGEESSGPQEPPFESVSTGAMAAIPGWLSGIDEGSISEEDTKPTRLSEAKEIPIPEELSEFVTGAVETGENQRSVTPSEEVAQTDDRESIPDWLQIPADESAVQELPFADTQPEEPSGVLEEPQPVEAGLLEPVSSEQDSAFDWLENLANQQENITAEPGAGAVEPASAGSQVFQAANLEEPVEAGAETEEAAGAAFYDETETLQAMISGAMAFKAPELSAIEEPASGAEPVEATLQGMGSSALVSEEADLAEEMGAYAGTEPGTDDELSAVGVYDLPDWLYEGTSELGPAQAGESKTAEAVTEPEPLGEPQAESPVPEKTETPSELLDLNQAALIELERVPGIGLLGAQAILAYRESTGQFSSLEDLRNVPGFDDEKVAQLAGRVTVHPSAPPEAAETPVDSSQVSLIQARNALAQSSREEALNHYTILIRSRTLLPEVIQDLHEALFRYPDNVPLLQTMGDAYARNDQLQDALDTYTKAEELLR